MLKLRCYRVTVVKLIELLVPSTSEDAARRHVQRWLDEEDTLADRSIAVIATRPRSLNCIARWTTAPSQRPCTAAWRSSRTKG